MNDLIEVFHKFWPEVITIIIISLIGVFYKFLRNIVTTFFKYIFFRKPQCNFEKCNFEVGIIKTLEKIQAELHPNGGSSLRDAINRIDLKVTSVSDRINTIQVSTEILSDTLNICRWSSDKNGLINFVNRSLRKLVGIIDDQLVMGDAWLANIVYIDDRNQTDIEWSRAVDTKSEYHHTFRIVNQTTNEIIKVTSHARLILNDKGEVSGWAGVLIPYDKI
jgi:PAS domain-containing protein